MIGLRHVARIVQYDEAGQHGVCGQRRKFTTDHIFGSRIGSRRLSACMIGEDATKPKTAGTDYEIFQSHQQRDVNPIFRFRRKHDCGDSVQIPRCIKPAHCPRTPHVENHVSLRPLPSSLSVGIRREHLASPIVAIANLDDTGNSTQDIHKPGKAFCKRRLRSVPVAVTDLTPSAASGIRVLTPHLGCGLRPRYRHTHYGKGKQRRNTNTKPFHAIII